MIFDELIAEDEDGPHRLERVREALLDFQDHFSHRVPKLVIEEGWIIDGAKVALELNGNGVYVLFDSHDQLLYVGVTEDDFRKRLIRHRQRFEPRYLDVIRVPQNFVWLSFSLERFLIKELQPRLNEVGI